MSFSALTTGTSAMQIEGRRQSAKEKTRLPPPEPAPAIFRYQQFGALTVLPRNFLNWLNSDANLPIIKGTPLGEAYRILSEILECIDYDFNFATFWFLDIVTEALFFAQEELNIGHHGQKVMLAWFTHILALMKDKHWSREEAFGSLHQSVLSAGNNFSHVGWDMPAPETSKSNFDRSSASSRSDVTSIDDMSKIVQLLYNVYANAFQFELITHSFRESSVISQFNMPHKLHFPRAYKPPPEPDDTTRRKETKYKKDKSASKVNKEKKGKKDKKDKKKKTCDNTENEDSEAARTAEAAAAAEQARLEAIRLEIEIFEKLQREKYNYILPLQDAVLDEYISRLFNPESELENQVDNEKTDKDDDASPKLKDKKKEDIKKKKKGKEKKKE